MRTVWVTGGHGFIGRHLGAVLGEGGRVVAGIGHGAWSDRESARYGFSYWLNSDISVGSLGQVGKITGLPDAVFHLAGGSSVGAAIGNPHEDFRRTVSSTAELLEWMRQCCPEASLIAVSSAAVYGSIEAARIAESEKLSPASPYGSHKRMMEELCQSYARNYGIRVVVPRLFSVYGPGLRKQLFWDLCEKIKISGGLELGGSGEEQRDWIHVSDVAKSLLSLARVADVGAQAVNIGTGIGTSVRDVAVEMTRAWGLSPTKAVIKFTGRSRPGDPTNLVANAELMKSLGLGTVVRIREGIIQYANWYRSAAR